MEESALASIHLITESDLKTALAFLFFSFSDLKKQDVDGMLASLIKKLCHRPSTKKLDGALMAASRGLIATL
ncbi:hypothetical protein XA68_14679 [Ophiocordyceps unilateralis]|uniref:Uncharacterized protein n=1 Tax=Ophiocordyceps unilateralis TaxID=268505 RepID=A0A2A9PA15_OPHUN|nr:hypothetical protein XA68_14679 [Ophiocordyceps unilateralis]